MQRRHRRTFTLITLVAIVVLGIISTLEKDVADKIVAAPEVRHLDAFMNNITLTAMDTRGRPAYRLTADRLERYSDSGNSLVKQPVFHFQGDGARWTARARQGIIDEDSVWITLEEDVELKQLDGEDPVTINTRLMKINTQTRVASTRESVRISRSNLELTATGMIYTHQKKQLELLANVKGQFIPE